MQSPIVQGGKNFSPPVGEAVVSLGSLGCVENNWLRQRQPITALGNINLSPNTGLFPGLITGPISGPISFVITIPYNCRTSRLYIRTASAR